MKAFKVGARLQSQVCQTQVIVVRGPAPDVVELHCGGQPMVDLGTEPKPGLIMAPEFALGSPVGKRFVHPNEGHLEVMVTRAGQGSLSLAGIALVIKVAKPLPASD